MTLRVLTTEQIEQFMVKGYVVVKGAFPRELAMEAQSFLWERLAEKAGVLRGDPSTWNEPMVNLRDNYRTPAFDACNTARFADAIEDLAGADRVARRHVDGETVAGLLPGWGWWPVNFHVGRGEPWTVPTSGWHWDGIDFRHYVDSPDQGLLCLCLFSDIGPRGGGTLVVEGSHRPVARYLARYPEGVELGDGIRGLFAEHPYFAALAGRGEPMSPEARNAAFLEQAYVDEDGTRLRVAETTGEAGDVILCHPFLIHAASPNHSGSVRFMCNRTSPLKEKLALDRAAREDESPLERSIRASVFA
ncbi:phytanoyl-CoA dioxygenase family protein [Paenibacillus sp. MWE-103]|uniref:Phytanoyl-CoA dioxygenase family protein n=1 Tax=Paenibacillus artemisiicola TaxID=1172618 RepID=A0ABS3WFV0_9BACL|nr:phytanoyl-CoA dioxygenase family protein [Paenibacillus artemisiicola]MBO7747162.1 phytanoyl-CoA dioxygenase family protein [Paenibacillus artemisiicola]